MARGICIHKVTVDSFITYYGRCIECVFHPDYAANLKVMCHLRFCVWTRVL